MNCPICGAEIPDLATACPRCGGEVEPAPEQQIENLKERLKAKIKENFRSHKLNEALNFIEVYHSTIGVDKEIYEIRNKIIEEKKKTSPTESGATGNVVSSAFEELIDSSAEVGSEYDLLLTDKTEAPHPQAPDEEPPAATFISAEDDLFSSSNYDLVLGTNEEIYSGEKEKDEPVVEIADESPFKVTDYHDFEPLQKESRPEPEESRSEEKVPLIFPQIEPEPEPPAEKKHRPLRRRNRMVVFGAIGVIALLAVAAVLYFLDPLGLKEKNADPTLLQVVTAPPIRPKPRPGAQAQPGKTTKPRSNQAASAPSQQDVQFNRYLELANDQFRKGNISQAQSNLISAKRIKSTDELISLELKILKRLKEMENSPSIDEQFEKNLQLKDDRTFERTLASDSIPAYEEYLRLYPAGRHTQEARRKITALEKKNRQSFETDLGRKVQESQQIQLRPQYKNLAIADIEAEALRLSKLSSRIEEMTIDEEKVVIDFATGLMWHQWEKPMFYDKAQWWAARRYSGYFDWRLPTTEEALTLARIEQGRFPYPWSTDYEVWTGDLDARNARSAWTINLSSRAANSVDFFKPRYVFSVRTIKR